MGNFKTKILGLSYTNDYLKDGKVVPVDKSELPIMLPGIDLNSSNPLENHPNWKKTKYKKTGEDAVRGDRYSRHVCRFFMVFY